MKRQLLAVSAIVVAAFFNFHASAELSVPAATPAELEAVYTTAIEGRTEDILKTLDLTDAAKSNAVHDIIIAQYRVMRDRDALIDATLHAEGREINYSNRASQLVADSKPLHEYFLARLSKYLTPAQIDVVKDKMTYNKVEFTYDAYLAIVPGLTDTDKAKIMELLKAAREEAMDGGSAHEKTEIFQKYKDQINDYLNTHGHDMAKDYKIWEAAHPKTNNPVTM